MRAHKLQRWFAVGAMLAMLALPVLAHAQEATLSGTVSDSTGGALPGVTVRAVHEASGNSFEAVTDARGEYRMPVRVGPYRLTADLAGFAPVTRTVTLLVGQQVVLNLQMAVSGVQETVTVTGEAPLLNLTQSSLGGNVDPRQMQELPVLGRDWTNLVLLAPGSRLNSTSGGIPSNTGFTEVRGDFQINVDGQQVTQQMSRGSGDGQPRFSRDAIAEFEFLSSRFDATQGRSSGVQVNAITKSGTNTPSGSFSGYFRDDRFIAKDFVANRVLPYQNQQLSGTHGGPIRKDRLHFFVNYEYERQPQTIVYTSPYPRFNIDQHNIREEHKAGVRLDAQFSPQNRLSVRGTLARLTNPFDRVGTATTTPSNGQSFAHQSNNIVGTLTQVLSNRAVNEVKVGFAGFGSQYNPTIKDPSGRFGPEVSVQGAPVILLRGLTIGGATADYFEHQSQDIYSFRDDLTYSFTKGGRHTMKLGGEYLRHFVIDERCQRCYGELDATGGPIPANIEDLFPDMSDVTSWNLAALSPITVRWRQNIGPLRSTSPRNIVAGWLQDDWTVSPRLTLNLGVRYDWETNAFANDVALLPFITSNRPDDTNNVAPRMGFSYSLNDRTVVRGGYGLYYGTVTTAYHAIFYSRVVSFAVENDRRRDFASNPHNGPDPTYESLLARICTPALAPGCIRRENPYTGRVYGNGFVMPYSHQPSIGLQRQLGNTMAIEADYVYVGAWQPADVKNINLTYDPATGANYPFTDISRRPAPEWGVFTLTTNRYEINVHSLQTAFTKRMSDGWQASGTYTLSATRDAFPKPQSANEVVSFATVPDLGGEYTLAEGDQRHRVVFNGIWQLPYGLQLSGLYHFGSGDRRGTSWGTDVRNFGTSAENRLRPNGTIVPRNNFVGKPIHRVDLRVQRRFPLGGLAGIEGIVEVFNVFNHANFGSYTTQENSTRYGRPTQNVAVAYAPRTLQLGFRFAF